MDLILKSFKDNSNGETIIITDFYKNVAITSTREKIDTHRLLDPRYYTPITSNTQQNTAPMITENRISNNMSLTEEIIDPNKFFSPNTTYNAFAEKIRSVSLDKIPYEDNNIPVVTTNNNINTHVDSPFYPSTNESAVLPYDPQDEIEELKAKYGASVVDTNAIARQTEILNKIANGEPVDNQNTQHINQNINSESPIVRIDADTHQVFNPTAPAMNPATTLFKGIKRVVDFDIELKLNNKIPRLDFIEMMEDSYESSIIDYLAEELTTNLLNNPSSIKNQIALKIRTMVSEASIKKIEPQKSEEKVLEKKIAKKVVTKPEAKPEAKATVKARANRKSTKKEETE